LPPRAVRYQGDRPPRLRDLRVARAGERERLADRRYVDEFDLDGKLVARVDRMGPLNEPWGLALAPSGFGCFAGRLLVGNFGSGRGNAYVRRANGWSFDGQLPDRAGKPLTVNGLWGISFGNGGMAGPKAVLFFAAGPHRWLGATELAVHGLFGSISLADR